jgi:hypothetical protein
LKQRRGFLASDCDSGGREEQPGSEREYPMIRNHPVALAYALALTGWVLLAVAALP